MDKKRIAVYLRVSTVNQDLRSQEPDLKAWLVANRKGREVTWYRDTLTGKTLLRPGMEKLEAAINAGAVGTLVVWRNDRLGRTARQMLAFLEDLDNRGVEVYSIRDGGLLDASTPAGRMFRHMLVGFAEYEREVISERIRAGIAKAKADGKRWGGRKAGQRTRLTDRKMHSIRALLAAGSKKAEIARQLGISERSVYRAVRISPDDSLVDLTARTELPPTSSQLRPRARPTNRILEV